MGCLENGDRPLGSGLSTVNGAWTSPCGGVSDVSAVALAKTRDTFMQRDG